MKKIALLALTAAFVVSCNKKEDAASRIGNVDETTSTETVVTTENGEVTGDSTSTVAQTGTPVIAFDTETHDFGNLKKGDKGEYEFTISNTGDADLIIIEAKASCGCTVPEKPEQPIKPGESAKMKVAFSANAAGMQSKTVTVTANTTSGTHLLTVKANVTE